MNIQEALAEVDRLQAEIEALRPINPEQEARVLQKFRLEWNYHSNAIEGNTLTFGETKVLLMHGLTARGKPLKDYLDIQGHDKVIDVLADIVRNEEELTEAAVRELHKILLGDRYKVKAVTPDGAPTSRWIEVGQYKTTPNHVRTITEKTHFFASPEETPAQMADLISWYREERGRGDLHPVVLASLFHHRFVSIHPFDDGNGRMARILMNLILMQAGFLPVVLKREKRSEYFLALEKADAGEHEDFVVFVAEALIESQNIYLKAARGEPIDELEDYDKRLRLLRQVIESEADAGKGQRTQQAQNYIVSSFVSTLFEAVSDRLVQLDPLFADKSINIQYTSSERSKSTGNQPIQDLVKWITRETSEITLSSIVLSYLAYRFINDIGRDFRFSIQVNFSESRLVVQIQLANGQAHEVFQAAYADLPGTDEAQQVAKTILDELIEGFSEFANGKQAD